MSKQNYTIFINRHCLHLTFGNKLGTPKIAEGLLMQHIVNAVQSGNNNATKIKHIDIATPSPEKLMRSLKKKLKCIYAAGGIVCYKEQYLYIHRKGHWDLPKGKIEKGEKIEAAALREVEEECGIQNLRIKHAIGSSFHVYQENKDLILKETYWFEMEYLGDNPELNPQTEEGITDVRFDNKDFLLQKDIKTYENLRLMVHDFNQLTK